MNKLQTFQDFLVNQSAQIAVGGFLLNLVLAAILSFLLGQVYIHHGTALTSRRRFAYNFLLLTTTTMLVIAIVKSSLALSLGLVGALSIVRFRAAIKEPEELIFLFLSIAIGLGLGADQRLITVVAFVFISGMIVLNKRYHSPRTSHNLYMTVLTSKPKGDLLNKIVAVVRANTRMADLKRFDESQELLEVTFQVEFQGMDQLDILKRHLQQLERSLRVTFLDHKGII